MWLVFRFGWSRCKKSATTGSQLKGEPVLAAHRGLQKFLNWLLQLPLPGRVLLAAGALAVVTGFAKISERPGIDRPATVPVDKLSSLPMELGRWQGEPSQIKDVINVGLDAKLALDRIYSTPAGEVVYLHLAAFDHFRQLAHHHPRVCYRGAGWEPVQSEVLKILDEPLQGQAPVCELITFSRQGEVIYVLYWYQVGELTTFTPDGVRGLWWRVREREPLPPQVKVLMQASAPSVESARAAMLELAGPVYRWVKEACTTGQSPGGQTP